MLHLMEVEQNYVQRYGRTYRRTMQNIRCPGGSFRPGIKRQNERGFQYPAQLRKYVLVRYFFFGGGRDPFVFISLSLHKLTFDTIVFDIVKYVGDWESGSARPSMMGSRLLWWFGKRKRNGITVPCLEFLNIYSVLYWQAKRARKIMIIHCNKIKTLFVFKLSSGYFFYPSNIHTGPQLWQMSRGGGSSLAHTRSWCEQFKFLYY